MTSPNKYTIKPTESTLIPDLENIIGGYVDITDYKNLMTHDPKTHTTDKLRLKYVENFDNNQLNQIHQASILATGFGNSELGQANEHYPDLLFLTTLYLKLLTAYDFETLRNYDGYEKLKIKFSLNVKFDLGEYIIEQIIDQQNVIKIELMDRKDEYLDLYNSKYPGKLKELQKLEELYENKDGYNSKLTDFLSDAHEELFTENKEVYSTILFESKYNDQFIDILNGLIDSEINFRWLINNPNTYFDIYNRKYPGKLQELENEYKGRDNYDSEKIHLLVRAWYEFIDDFPNVSSSQLLDSKFNTEFLEILNRIVGHKIDSLRTPKVAKVTKVGRKRIS
jgi:hypothetical protein